MRLKHYLSCMLILLSFVTVNAQEKKELKEGDHKNKRVKRIQELWRKNIPANLP